MAWRQKSQTPPSTVKQLLPLLITLVVLGLMAVVCYQVYVSWVKIQAQARQQMGESVVFSREGVRVNVQDIGSESYLDRTQRWFVKAWNLGTTPSAQEHEEGARRRRNVLAKLKSGERHHDHHHE
ncbi:uncharacterized protein B0T15DRAFT_493658 [Chaetomium strumarium]|uniref:Uncharacterized protein n=1 Tax=Chaetomium strumarium TaxID=1170767 RepID=A0AAJ0GSU7_9PEZI|nr:hypothetical protein B0T15DRAFT_493658 [Chaetomium strumarium]